MENSEIRLPCSVRSNGLQWTRRCSPTVSGARVLLTMSHSVSAGDYVLYSHSLVRCIAVSK